VDAARPNAAANPINEMAFRREIISDLMIALIIKPPVEQRFDANDQRSQRSYLTVKGVAFARRVSTAMKFGRETMRGLSHRR
jgi:hypothetical protein